MCAEIFWKKLVTFSLTFALGFLITDSLSLNAPPTATEVIKIELPSSKVEQGNMTALNTSADRKKCVPVDENLRYEFLNEKDFSTQSEFLQKNSTKRGTKRKSSSNELKSKVEQLEKLDEFRKRLGNSLKIHNRNSYQRLLHLEKCYELNGRK